jgi:four helix bundle protein
LEAGKPESLEAGGLHAVRSIFFSLLASKHPSVFHYSIAFQLASFKRESANKTMENERWRNLEVWQNADELAFQVYQTTRRFPKEEVYGLTSQMRRSALSIPTNIVEGYSRKGDKELQRFLNISLGSLAETKYLLHFANRLGYIEEKVYNNLQTGYENLGRMLWRFYEKVKG